MLATQDHFHASRKAMRRNLARIWQEFGKIWQDLASLLLHAASCALVFRALSIWISNPRDSECRSMSRTSTSPWVPRPSWRVVLMSAACSRRHQSRVGYRTDSCCLAVHHISSENGIVTLTVASRSEDLEYNRKISQVFVLRWEVGHQMLFCLLCYICYVHLVETCSDLWSFGR